VIAGKASDNVTLTLDAALEYRHLGETYTVGEKTFDMRAEVGLLTRNIKIKGKFYIKNVQSLTYFLMVGRLLCSQ